MKKTSEKLRNGDSASFWNAAEDGFLVLQKCRSCRQVQFPPRHVCSACWSEDVVDVESPGKGTIESVTVVRRAPVAAFRDKTPYTIVAVVLDEGPRMITVLEQDSGRPANIGDRAEVIFDSSSADHGLPAFRVIRG